MMARRREERYQDVSVILEDFASYERRKLLDFSAHASYVPLGALSTGKAAMERTQLYTPGERGA
jgi:hypothetical protein